MMKRQDRDREGSPRGNKRSRSSVYGPPDHGMGRDRMSPEFDRRSARKFMGEGLLHLYPQTCQGALWGEQDKDHHQAWWEEAHLSPLTLALALALARLVV
ncbi:hypothetical protein ACOMHN_058284 [Nucella lapillus]